MGCKAINVDLYSVKQVTYRLSSYFVSSPSSVIGTCMSMRYKALGMHSYWGLESGLVISTWLFMQRYIYYGKWKCVHNQKITNLVTIKSLTPMELVMKSISCAVTVALLTVANIYLTDSCFQLMLGWKRQVKTVGTM